MEIKTIGPDTVKITLNCADLKRLTVPRCDSDAFVGAMLECASDAVGFDCLGEKLYVEVFEKSNGCVVYISGCSKCRKNNNEKETSAVIKCNSAEEAFNCLKKLDGECEIYADTENLYIITNSNENLVGCECNVFCRSISADAVREHCEFLRKHKNSSS